MGQNGALLFAQIRGRSILSSHLRSRRKTAHVRPVDRGPFHVEMNSTIVDDLCIYACVCMCMSANAREEHQNLLLLFVLIIYICDPRACECLDVYSVIVY